MPSDEPGTDASVLLSYEDILTIHAVTMTQMGDYPRPVIDEFRLRSKLMRSINAYHYQGVRDPFLLSAMTAVAVSQAHAFEDGNKRTALGVLTVLLGLAGYGFIVEDVSVGQWFIAIAETPDRDRDIKTEDFAAWLGQVTEPIAT